jgi:hypothetical protein
MRKTLQIDKESVDGGVSIGGVHMSNLKYADDTTLIAANMVRMQEIMKCLEEVSAEYGLRINRAKTKMMEINPGENTENE